MENINNSNKGVVFNIQNFTVHDGPGIRTEVFLKGCTHRCKWCSNPESFKVSREVGLYATRCIGVDKCGLCIKACPEENALIAENNMIVGIDRSNCTNCLKCADVCPSNALQYWGKLLSIDDVMKAILPDKGIYTKSGGGVTLSGGESLVQWEFALEILKACKKEKIHTCVESTLHCDPEILDAIFPYADLFISDIKHIDNEKNLLYTGQGNTLTLKNIKKVIDAGKPIIIRIPVVPEHNDDFETMDAISDYLVNELENKVNQLQFLRYRRLGEEKYKSLGMDYKMSDVEYPKIDDFEEKINSFVELFKSKGIPAVNGSTNKMDFK